MAPDDRDSIHRHGAGQRGRLNLEPIRSQANPLIKDIRSLQQRRRRYQERAFVVEGTRLVQDVLSHGIEPRHIILREDVTAGLLPTLPEALHPLVRVVDERTFAVLSDVPHPQGILAVVPMLERSLEALEEVAHPLVVVI
ncbi:MAG: RNA methyltransferase substrate-binding domain-containing protein, partial [Thermomicrobiales bacterium]